MNIDSPSSALGRLLAMLRELGVDFEVINPGNFLGGTHYQVLITKQSSNIEKFTFYFGAKDGSPRKGPFHYP